MFVYFYIFYVTYRLKFLDDSWLESVLRFIFVSSLFHRQLSFILFYF